MEPNMNESCPDERFGSESVFILSVWLSFTSLATITGNALVMWLFYEHESLRTVSNRFIISLATADILVGLVINPVWIAVRYVIQPPFISTGSEILEMLWIHTTAATTFNLCCVSVDRFIAICFPLRYRLIVTKRTCHFSIISAWLASIFLPFSLLFVSEENMEILIAIPAATFLVPNIIVAFCYAWIFKAARRQIRRIQDNSFQNNTVYHAVKNYKALKTVGMVVGVFIASWMPCLVATIVHEVKGEDYCLYVKYYNAVWPWIEAIAFTSSAINPWIYCFRNIDFREVLNRRFSWFP